MPWTEGTVSPAWAGPLAQLYKKKPYVRAVEVMVSTSAALGPERFGPIGQQAVARIARNESNARRNGI